MEKYRITNAGFCSQPHLITPQGVNLYNPENFNKTFIMNQKIPALYRCFCTTRQRHKPTPSPLFSVLELVNDR